MREDLKLMLVGIILSVLFLVFLLILSAVIRRFSHKKKYRELDRERELNRATILNALGSGRASVEVERFSSSPGSPRWRAIEDVLLDLITDEKYREDVKAMLVRLGYTAHYEKQLMGNPMARSYAVDKLGKMLSASSANWLTGMLKDKHPDVVAVTIRALSRIGSMEGLKKILDQLPDLLEKGIVSRKTVETSLVNFGVGAVPLFFEYLKASKDPRITSSLLEVLSNFRVEESLPYAMDNLRNENPEVRAKALKVVGASAPGGEENDARKVASLLEDPVWFVRLQAAKAVGNWRYTRAADLMGALLLDEKWQVRNAAATALTKIGDASIDVFLRVLTYRDLYAKESLCEELERTNVVYRLIENLGSDERAIYEKSRRILEYMCSLGFTTPFVEYGKREAKGRIAKEIDLLLGTEAQ